MSVQVKAPISVVFLAVVLLIGGCSPAGDSEPSTTPGGQAAPTTTEVVTTTTVAPFSTTTSAPTSTTIAPKPSTTSGVDGVFYSVTGAPDLSAPEPLPGSDGAGGSGCAPGSAALPDGVWFGYVLNKNPHSLLFDLACFYTGDIANQRALAAGQEPHDFYIANDSSTTRDVPFGNGATVWSITGDPTAGLQQLSIADWPGAELTYTPCPGEYCTVWIYVNSGSVTEIMEQYLP